MLLLFSETEATVLQGKAQVPHPALTETHAVSSALVPRSVRYNVAVPDSLLATTAAGYFATAARARLAINCQVLAHFSAVIRQESPLLELLKRFRWSHFHFGGHALAVGSQFKGI